MQLTLRDISKRYPNGVQALDKVSLTIPQSMGAVIGRRFFPAIPTDGPRTLEHEEAEAFSIAVVVLPQMLGAGGTYYWRSRAYDGANTGPFSAAAAPVLERRAPMVGCIRPYAPEIAGLRSTWMSWSQGYDPASWLDRAINATREATLEVTSTTRFPWP